jgi:hypothetical protein
VPVLNFHGGEGLGVMLLVGTREIEPGEELLVDYFRSHLLGLGAGVPDWLEACKED